MEFLRDLWTLLLNTLFGRDLKEKDPHVMDDLPVVPAPDERVEPAIPVVDPPKPTPTPEPFLEDLPTEKPEVETAPVEIPKEEVPEENAGLIVANPGAVNKVTVVEADPPAPPVVEATPPVAEDYGAAAPLVRALQKLGHKVFLNGTRPFNLNIVGERNTKNPTLDKFGCRIHVFWKWNGQWHLRSWAATTYPGSRYLVETLLNPKGAAILAEGQYKDTYAMDLHGGRYRALCQRLGSVVVYRDGNRDRKFDLNPSTRMTGMYGINVHAPITVKAGMKTYIANKVYAASAGCQVFQRLQDFLEFRDLCDKAEKEWGNKFTYTLIRDVDVDWSAPI